MARTLPRTDLKTRGLFQVGAHTTNVFASSNYPPDKVAADRFVADMRHGTLIACGADGYPQVSILPFVKTDDVIELHCVQADPTFAAVRINQRVTFFISTFLRGRRMTGLTSGMPAVPRSTSVLLRSNAT